MACTRAITVGSAEMPLVTPGVELVNLHNKHGLECMSRGLIDLAETLIKPQAMAEARLIGINLSATALSITRDFERGNHRNTLLAVLPAPVLQAILTGAFAWLVCKKIDVGLYKSEGAGIYVVGMAIQGRKGAWLTRLTLEALIARIKRYIGAAFIVRSVDPSRRTVAQAAEVRWLEQIDTLTGPKPAGLDVRCCNNLHEEAYLLAFIKALQRRCHGDPQGTTPMIQSPLYVGCSNELKRRTKDYKASNLTRVNKPLTLVNMLVLDMNLPNKIHIHTVLRVWKQEQLPIAECLVATLASAMVHQCGFNTIQAGLTAGTFDAAVARQGKEEVFLKGAFQHNIQELKAAWQRQIDWSEKLNELSHALEELSRRFTAIDNELTASAATLEALFEEFKVSNLRELLDSFERRLERLKDRLDDKNLLARRLALYERMWRRLRPEIYRSAMENLPADVPRPSQSM